MSQITIQFTSSQQRDNFVRLYQRTQNYHGQVRQDRSLGASFAEWVYLDSQHVQDFRRLGQDVMMHGGKIV
jgi:hypothetical protein